MVNAMSNNPAGQWLTVSLGDLTDAKERLSVAFRGTTCGFRLKPARYSEVKPATVPI